MNIFHTHNFSPSENDPQILYCYCGKTEDIHRHKWIKESNITDYKNNVKGWTLICEICGELKNHMITD